MGKRNKNGKNYTDQMEASQLRKLMDDLKKYNVFQSVIAEALGFSSTSLGAWKNGENPIPAEAKAKFEELGVSKDYFRGYDSYNTLDVVVAIWKVVNPEECAQCCDEIADEVSEAHDDEGVNIFSLSFAEMDISTVESMSDEDAYKWCVLQEKKRNFMKTIRKGGLTNVEM